MDNTFISFYLKEYKIRVFAEALRGLDSPKRICFMLDEDGNRLLMLPHAKKDFVSHAVPDSVYSGGGRMEVNSKKLCWILAGQHGWDKSRSYRVPGVIVAEKQVAAFDLTRAEQITT